MALNINQCVVVGAWVLIAPICSDTYLCTHVCSLPLLTLSLQAHFLDTSDLSELDSVRLTNTVLDLAVYDHTHLAIGSTSIQVIDIENRDRRRTVADDTNDDESLENPPLHLVKFGPKGYLVTASAENNIVKLWPPVVTQAGGVVTMPKAMFVVGEECGYIQS